MTTATSRRVYTGPPLFSFGFRPRFLLACAWPALIVPMWVLAYLGYPPLAGALTRDCHVHEMLFGYLSGVMAGFLLAAVPNWTGRLPVLGPPLVLLVGIWVAGRVAMVAAPQSLWSAIIDFGLPWSLAFGGFVILYGPMLIGPRADLPSPKTSSQSAV